MAPRLLRRGYRLATRLQGDFVALYVRVPGAALTAKEQELIDQAADLTREMGGQFVELQGDSVAEEVVRYVRDSGTTYIVMGQSARSRMEEVLRGSIINRIMRETTGVDIVVVADSDRAEVEG